jgi:hypothetical protein
VQYKNNTTSVSSIKYYCTGSISATVIVCDISAKNGSKNRLESKEQLCTYYIFNKYFFLKQEFYSQMQREDQKIVLFLGVLLLHTS